MAFAGLDHALVRKIRDVRGALDKRVETACFGKTAEVAETQRVAVRRARVGNYSGLRWFHLIKKTDNGTNADPLKGLKAFPAAARVGLMQSSLAQLLVIVPIATPVCAATASPFMQQLFKYECEALEAGVSVDTLSAFHALIMRKVTRSTKEYFTGYGGGDGLPKFDTAWITASSEERDEVEREWQQQRAKQVYKQEHGSDKGKGKGKDKPPNPGKTGNKGNKNGKRKSGDAEEEEEEEVKATSADLRLKLTQVQRSSSIPAGPEVPKPLLEDGKLDKDAMRVWEQAAGIEKQGTKWPCWDFFHPQGCKRGAKCRFHHLE